MADASSKIVPLAPASEALGRQIAHSSGRKRMDVLLSKENARSLIRALPTEDLYYLIKDVGLADAGLLVSMATPEQFQGFVDLEAWEPHPEGAQLQTDRVLEWLEVVRDADDEAYRPKLQSLDLEIIELILRGGLHIVDRREEEEAPRPPPRPGSEDLTWETTPCGNFYVAYTEPDTTEGKALRRMLDEIYAIDAFGAARLLSAVRVELDSELSEAALQVRTARMEDLGFPPLELALGLYARRDPKAELPAQPASPENVPGFQLAQLPAESFLQRAAGRVLGVGPRTHLDRALLYLCNMALVADRVPTHDDEAVRLTTARVHATLSLALEELSGGDEAVASGLLQERALKALFQVGFTLGLDLQAALKRALEGAGLGGEALASHFDEPERSGIEGLLQRRPVLARAVTEAHRRGWPGNPEAYLEEGEAPLGELPEGYLPFSSLAQLALGRQVVEMAGAAARLLGAGGALHLEAHEEDETSPALAARIATLLCARAAGREGGLAPLTPEEASRGLAALFAPDGALVLEPWRTLAAELTGEDEGARRMVARAFARLVAEVRPVYLAGDTPDPRFLPLLWLVD
ncbi:MAG: DUF6178 family protein [Deltaproteobacteria bacterium]|nr:DUF6178 family protein [Deltaproteobacteria bacterium]